MCTEGTRFTSLGAYLLTYLLVLLPVFEPGDTAAVQSETSATSMSARQREASSKIVFFVLAHEDGGSGARASRRNSGGMPFQVDEEALFRGGSKRSGAPSSWRAVNLCRGNEKGRGKRC